MAELGALELFTDDDGRECRRELQAQAECPRCGKEVDLWAESTEWYEENGHWMHASYGPADGICCGLLIVDGFEECSVYELEPRKT